MDLRVASTMKDRMMSIWTSNHGDVVTAAEQHSLLSSRKTLTIQHCSSNSPSVLRQRLQWPSCLVGLGRITPELCPRVLERGADRRDVSPRSVGQIDVRLTPGSSKDGLLSTYRPL